MTKKTNQNDPLLAAIKKRHKPHHCKEIKPVVQVIVPSSSSSPSRIQGNDAREIAALAIDLHGYQSVAVLFNKNGEVCAYMDFHGFTAKHLCEVVNRYHKASVYTNDGEHVIRKNLPSPMTEEHVTYINQWITRNTYPYESKD